MAARLLPGEAEHSRSHALRGNARPDAPRPIDLRPSGRRAAKRPFPRRAWERDYSSGRARLRPSRAPGCPGQSPRSLAAPPPKSPGHEDFAPGTREGVWSWAGADRSTGDVAIGLGGMSHPVFPVLRCALNGMRRRRSRVRTRAFAVSLKLLTVLRHHYRGVWGGQSLAQWIAPDQRNELRQTEDSCRGEGLSPAQSIAPDGGPFRLRQTDPADCARPRRTSRRPLTRPLARPGEGARRAEVPSRTPVVLLGGRGSVRAAHRPGLTPSASHRVANP